MYRNTWLEVDLDAIESNVRATKAAAGKKYIAVLKADAYGSGDIQVARAAVQAGADMIAVSSLDEALMLRNEGCKEEMLILGGTNPEDVPVLIANNISTAAYSSALVKGILQKNCKGLKVHLKVDTGMNRIGFKNLDELKTAKQALLDGGCRLTGIFTYFACADTSEEMTQKQFERFAAAVKACDYPFEWIHCDNSDASVHFKDPLSNACRVGISLYGISTYMKDLKPALSLYSEIFMVKHVPAGETIGYGATYTTPKEEIIATLPIGYADGWIRANQGRSVYVNGSLCEVVGRICMDQCMIRLDHEEPVGTRVEIFGPHISLEQMAVELHTIPYEIICLLSDRVTRIYTRSGRPVDEENSRLRKSQLAD